MLIQVCLNGSREPGAHLALPLTPAELAQAARAAVDAGAGAIHMHPRRADGTQSFDTDDIAAAFTAVRAVCPGVPVGGTTIEGIARDPAHRLALVRAWTVLPDFVSVNMSEDGAVELCTVLIEVGISIEAGIATPEEAQILIASGLANDCLRILIEPVDETVESAVATIQAIETLLDAARVQVPRLLHGFDITSWPILDLALERGYDTRIGLEDTLFLPDGSLTHDNAELVVVACARARRVGRVQ